MSLVGYLVTDIVGSVEKGERAPDEMDAAQARCNELIARLVKLHGGVVRDYAGDGAFSVFADGNPLLCAFELQLALQADDWGGVGGLQVRAGVHCARHGAEQSDRLAVNRAARIAQAAWGGQIVASEAAANAYAAPQGARFDDLGRYRLRGIEEPMTLLGLTHERFARNQFPPLRATPASQAVVAPLTPIFGREDELAALLAHFGAGARVICIAGLAGNGKTRLALEAGALRGQSVPVYVAFLQDVAAPEQAIAAIAAALRFPLRGQERQQAQVLDYLRNRDALLVLDNADLLAGRAGFLGEILSHCPGVQILATSREPLGVPGEQVVRLEGLRVADSVDAPACALFLHDAARATPAFAPDAHDMIAIGDICRRLAGSPLAIHLVAQWTRLLSVAEIRDRVASGAGVLGALGPLDRAPLKTVFEGSWGMLNEAERETLLRLSLFEGLERRDAEIVAEADLSVLGALERKSLLERREGHRLVLHPLVHAFVRQKLGELGAAAQTRTRNRHAEHYLAFVETCAREAVGPAQARMLDRFQAEMGNVGVAWRATAARGDFARLEACAEALFYLCAQRALFRDCDALMSVATLDAAIGAYFASLRANCLAHLGDIAGAETLATGILRAEAVAPRTRGHCHQALGNAAHMRGDLVAARRHYEAALAERRSRNDAMGTFYSAMSLAWLEVLGESSERARPLLRESYALCQRMGHLGGMLTVHVLAGDIAILENRLRDAQESYALALDMEESVRNPQHRAATLAKLGRLHADAGAHEQAVACLEEAAQLASSIGDRRLECVIGLSLGAALRRAGQFGLARHELHEALDLARDLAMDDQLATTLVELGHLARATDDRALARRIGALLRAPRFEGHRAARAALLADMPEEGLPLTDAEWDDALLEVVNARTYGLLRL